MRSMDKDTPMHYRTIGNGGAVVSTFALGTMTFGAEADEATSHAILGDYVESGGNLIDTADVYSQRGLGGDHRGLARSAPHGQRAGRDRHEGTLHDGRWPQRPRHVPAPPRSRA